MDSFRSQKNFRYGSRQKSHENIPSLQQEIPDDAFELIPPDGVRENRMFGSIYPGGKEDLHAPRAYQAS